MIEMKVKTIAMDTESKAPVMILTDLDERRYLPIWIGGYEAAAIIDELEGNARARPMTHDLLKIICTMFNTKVRRVIVNDLQESTYFARLVLETDGKEVEVDARPSDSVAMALRFKAPIFVTENVIQAASIADKGKLAEENRKFKDFIEHLSADMFMAPGVEAARGVPADAETPPPPPKPDGKPSPKQDEKPSKEE